MSRPTMPENLTADAVSVWEALIDDLEAAGVLERADGAVIEGAAVLLGRAREARAILNARGLTYESTRTSAPTLRPEWRVEREAWTAFRMIAETLGLSPAARAKLGLNKPTKSPDWDATLGVNPRWRTTTFNDEVTE